MAFLPWLIMALIAAVVAKSIMGVEGGWLPIVLLALAGTTIGGWTGAILGGAGELPFFSLSSWFLAILGAVVVLWAYGRISARQR